MASPQERTIDVRNGHLKTKVLVRGPPIVFLHGPLGVTWDEFLQDLSAQFTVYASLHPGLSEPDDIRKFDTLWDLVLYHYDLFDALGLNSPAVVGHSYGGMLAAEVAATGPERVSKLVLIDPLGFWLDDYPVRDWMSGEPGDLLRATFYDHEGEIARRLTAVPEDPEEEQDFRIQRTWALACTGRFVWPIPDKGLKNGIYRVKAPTLIVWGGNDGIVDPVYAQEFEKRIENALVEVHVVDQAGHLPRLEQRGQVVGLIRNFV